MGHNKACFCIHVVDVPPNFGLPGRLLKQTPCSTAAIVRIPAGQLSPTASLFSHPSGGVIGVQVP